MGYIKGEPRRQRLMFPEYLDDYIKKDSEVRVIDKFVSSLDMSKLGFIRSTPAKEGTPGYNPRDLLKLYIYSYFNGIRSSRKIASECYRNIEVMWLICKLTPDFRTISDFRKDNKASIKGVFKELNKRFDKLGLFRHTYYSIDGSKFKAVNAKDNNFTLAKLDDRIKRLEEDVDNYMALLDEEDAKEDNECQFSKEELQKKLDACKKRLDKYNDYRSEMEKTGQAQMSLTDKDARLMKQNEGFGVDYNVQTAVDESHLIADFQITQSPTDHGQITPVMEGLKDSFDKHGTITESIADKGYISPTDTAASLANGNIPNVIQRDNATSTTVEYEYQEHDITDAQKSSTKPEDIKACLESGVVPDCYKGRLTFNGFVEKNTYSKSADVPDRDVARMTTEERQNLAKDRKVFVRDAERNLVYCPLGEILRQKSLKNNGKLRYCNKLACKHCQNKCTASKWKEVDFDKDTLIQRSKLTPQEEKKDLPKDNHTPNGKRKAITRKYATYTLQYDMKKLDNRKCMSEHPFGTIKRSLGDYYFLLKTKVKVEAEFALFSISYNLRRALNMLSPKELMAAMA